MQISDIYFDGERLVSLWLIWRNGIGNTDGGKTSSEQQHTSFYARQVHIQTPMIHKLDAR